MTKLLLLLALLGQHTSGHRDLHCVDEMFNAAPTVTVNGRLSEVALPAGNYSLDGNILWDCDFGTPGYHVRILPTAVFRNDPDKASLRFLGTTLYANGDVKIVQTDPERAIDVSFAPRLGCTASSGVCLCDDEADILGGAIWTGPWHWEGAAKTPHVRPSLLTATGATIEQTGWRDGDEVCIPGVVEGQTEYRTITVGGEPVLTTVSVYVPLQTLWQAPADRLTFDIVHDTNGNTLLQASYETLVEQTNQVTFDRPLTYEHVEFDGQPVVIANLARNITFRSADTSTVERRAHMMAHNASASYEAYTRVTSMGRTRADIPVTFIQLDADGKAIGNTRDMLGAAYNQGARYSRHPHKPAGDTDANPFVYVGCVTDGGLKWLIDNHGCYVVGTDCVCVNAQGAGLAGENGFSRGEWVNSFVADIRLPGHVISNGSELARKDNVPQDWGWGGHGITQISGGIATRGGHVYDCGIAHFYYGLWTSQSDRQFPLVNLREGDLKRYWTQFKKSNGTPLYTTIQVDNIPVSVDGLSSHACKRSFVSFYHQAGIESSRVKGGRHQATDVFIETHYCKAGTVPGAPDNPKSDWIDESLGIPGYIVQGCTIKAPKGNNDSANNVTSIWLDHNTLSGHVTGWSEGNSAGSKAYTKITAGLFEPATVNSVDIKIAPAESNWNADIKTSNRRVDGTPAKVLGI